MIKHSTKTQHNILFGSTCWGIVYFLCVIQRVKKRFFVNSVVKTIIRSLLNDLESVRCVDGSINLRDDSTVGGKRRCAPHRDCRELVWGLAQPVLEKSRSVSGPFV